MSVLRSLESKIAGLVEGTFSRAFRSEVRPVEIARKLAREMEEHKSFPTNTASTCLRATASALPTTRRRWPASCPATCWSTPGASAWC
jgi:hypothetical protein